MWRLALQIHFTLEMVRQDVFVPIVRKVAIVAPRLPVAWSATALYIWTKSSIVLKCVLMVSTPREMKIEGAAA